MTQQGTETSENTYTVVNENKYAAMSAVTQVSNCRQRTWYCTGFINVDGFSEVKVNQVTSCMLCK